MFIHHQRFPHPSQSYVGAFAPVEPYKMPGFNMELNCEVLNMYEITSLYKNNETVALGKLFVCFVIFERN